MEQLIVSATLRRRYNNWDIKAVKSFQGPVERFCKNSLLLSKWDKASMEGMKPSPLNISLQNWSMSDIMEFSLPCRSNRVDYCDVNFSIASTVFSTTFDICNDWIIQSCCTESKVFWYSSYKVILVKNGLTWGSLRQIIKKFKKKNYSKQFFYTQGLYIKDYSAK